jgi:hypothetical protein
MLKLALITLGIVSISVLLLCIKMLLRPDGQFSSQHIGNSKAMRQRGIHCVQSMDALERRENPYKVSERI